MNKPLVTTIIPVYNIEGYLKESIDSVINQKLSFEENIEIILVDDGSTDNSNEICREYVDRYPDNISLITKRNSGVSAARNLGFQSARGKYIHFFDGDDIISSDYYSKSVKFLDANAGIDFVASKIKFFDEIIDSHPLNNKFNSGDRIIDLITEPDAPILHVITCIFRGSSIVNIKFDKNLTIAEDIKFISDVLLLKKKYGVIKSPTYYYRKRTSSSSAIGGKFRNLNYYKNTPKYAYLKMLEDWSSVETASIEHTVLYDISYVLDQKQQSILSNKQQEDFIKDIRTVISKCSKESILSSKYLSVHKKLYALECIYKEGLNSRLSIQDSSLYFDDHKLYDYKEKSVYIDFLTDNKDGTYTIEGYIDSPISNTSVTLLVNNQEVQLVERVQREQSFLGEVYFNGGAFKATTVLNSLDALSFIIRTAIDIVPRIETGPFTKFDALPLTYRRDGDRLIKRTPSKLLSYPYSKFKHAQLELRMMVQICMNLRIGTVRERLKKLRSYNLDQLSLKGKLFEIAKPWFFMAEAIYTIPRALLLRTLYYAIPKKRPIWLVQDRGVAAGDNGEALFKYIVKQQDCPANVYFVISAKYPDYKRMKQYGKVLNQDSLMYKFMFLRADKIISSQADIETDNPFIRQRPHYANLFNFDFVFLQHGIIRYDLSDWLNRYNKNIRLFITSAEKEYQSMFSNPYYYPEDHILLSGLPRYDYLVNKPNKKLILAPTYRKNLARMKTDKNGARKYDPWFKNSEYFKFYNGVMNDTRIVKALKEAGMVGEYVLHPVFAMQARDFVENDQFKVKQYPYDYKKAFSEGELLISDHSSVVFDFAYLKKPVVYAYFDVDTFFEGHTYNQSDFFSDEEHGFGPVCDDYESLVKAVVGIIECGNKMDDKYKVRVDDFFYKVDTNNSKRVYDAIRLLDTV